MGQTGPLSLHSLNVRRCTHPVLARSCWPAAAACDAAGGGFMLMRVPLCHPGCVNYVSKEVAELM